MKPEEGSLKFLSFYDRGAPYVFVDKGKRLSRDGWLEVRAREEILDETHHGGGRKEAAQRRV